MPTLKWSQHKDYFNRLCANQLIMEQPGEANPQATFTDNQEGNCCVCLSPRVRLFPCDILMWDGEPPPTATVDLTGLSIDWTTYQPPGGKTYANSMSPTANPGMPTSFGPLQLTSWDFRYCRNTRACIFGTFDYGLVFADCIYRITKSGTNNGGVFDPFTSYYMTLFVGESSLHVYCNYVASYFDTDLDTKIVWNSAFFDYSVQNFGGFDKGQSYTLNQLGQGMVYGGGPAGRGAGGFADDAEFSNVVTLPATIDVEFGA